jgi:hypothetical protein
MKRAQILMSIFLSVLLVLCAPSRGLGQGKPKVAAPRADDAIPKRPDFNRYAAMVDRSPFAVATAPTEAAGPPTWAKDLFIANAAHTPEVDLVTIMSLSDKNMKEYMTTEKPNDHGYGIANIEWSDNPGGTKVTLSKDGQFATIGFNEALTTQGPQPFQPQPPPGVSNIPAGVKPQPMAPQPALPAPHVRGMIQRTRQVPGITPPPIPNAAPVDAPGS